MLGTEVLNHWYIVLIGIALIAALYFLYVKPVGKLILSTRKQYVSYYLIHLLCFVVFIPLAVFGIRGGVTRAVRPITISNANQYVNRPTEAAIVLNTPFSMIRTIGKNVYKDPKYFSREELSTIYEPIIVPNDTVEMQKKNVVVLIIESFGREYIGIRM